MEKLTAYQIWKKKQNENLSDEQYKQLLIENGVVILNTKPSKELLTMLTSFVQGNREDYAIEVYNLCVKEFSEGKKDDTGERRSNIPVVSNNEAGFMLNALYEKKVVDNPKHYIPPISEVPFCPNCESDNTHENLRKHHYRCYDCGFAWAK